VPALAIAKAADTTAAVAGDTVSYTVTATNSGETPYAAADLTDSLRGVLDDATYGRDAAASRGTVTYSAGTLRWTGVLPVGESVVITYSVAATGAGDGDLANRVTSASRGASCPPNGTDPACVTSTPVAGGDGGSGVPEEPGPSPSSPGGGSDGGSGNGSDGSDSSSDGGSGPGGGSGSGPGGSGGASTIELTDLTQAFRLRGLPGSTVTAADAVTMLVTTDDPNGYVVTVRGTSAVLRADKGNDATIPIARLFVRDAAGRFRPLSTDTPVVVHRRVGPSWPSGDPIGNDYRVDIPYLPADSYETTLEYVVGSQ
jgi:uncharacterized repeat protein (TIGR01451 family)